MRYHPTIRRFLFLLAGSLCLYLPGQAQYFADVPVADADQAAIDNAVINQLMEGYPNGSFRPDAPLSRVESLMVMARLLNLAYRSFMILPISTSAEGVLAGLPPRHWVSPAAQFLASHGMLDKDSRIDTVSQQPLSRTDLLHDLSRLLHGGRQQPARITAEELAERRILPESWADHLEEPVTRRDMARMLELLLIYLSQHAVAEGTIIDIDTDDTGLRWVRLQTAIGETRLCLPERGIMVQGGSEESIRAGARVRTLSDAVNGTRGRPYYRVRKLTILAETAAHSE